MHNDIMCIRSTKEVIVSSVTLYALADSGWYSVIGCSQDPVFGRSAGCAYFEQKCITPNGQSNNPELWCSTHLKPACDAFNLNKGLCQLPSNLSPAIYHTALRYFSSSTKGGNDKYEDYCPYVVASVSGDCRDSANTGSSYETFGSKSKCLEHTMTNPGSSDPVLVASASCFEVNCLPNGDAEVTYKASPSFTFVCPKLGGTVYVVNSLFTGAWVKCPRKGLCPDVPCPKTCCGQGCCNSGSCQCYDGFYGTDCCNKCDVSCEKCNESCCQRCAPGFYQDGCQCKPCDPCCEGCTGAGPDKCIAIKAGKKYTYDALGKINGCASEGQPICKRDYDVPSTSCCTGCLSCSSDNCCKCFECVVGYFITADGLCTKDCVANCLQCNTPTECKDCKVGYDLTEDGRCLTCPDGCVDCIKFCSSNVCGAFTSCNTGNNCIENCYSCSTTQCTACKSGWYMDTATKLCKKTCPSNCRTCSGGSPNSCLTCNAGFYLSTLTYPNTCEACETSCLTCTYLSLTATSCSICRAGFFRRQITSVPVNWDCIDCKTGCYKCTSENDCSQCIARWYLSGNDCLRCEYGCKICTNDVTCTIADPGFYIKTDGRVARCHKSCATCDSDLICNTCLIGFFFYECASNNCLCRDCENNCASCVSSSECMLCRVGWYLNVGNTCSACDPLCYTCEQAGKCLTCRWGYYLEENKQCQKCGTGCQHCVNIEKCILCLPGYWPDEFGCQLCEPNCAFCYTGTECHTCKLGWYLDADNHCQQCESRCIRCTLTQGCLVCKVGFYPVNGVCTPCGSNCAFCVSQTECTICNNGYYLKPDNTCSICQNGCINCCDEYTCMKARPGWWLDYFPGIYSSGAGKSRGTQDQGRGDGGGYAAVKCKYKCGGCNNGNDCLACEKGTYLSSNNCLDCTAPCSACSSSTLCSQCSGPFYVDEGRCIACQPNCNLCTKTQCTQPKGGFYVNPDSPTTVLPCVYPCSSCVGNKASDCLTCRGGCGKVLGSEVPVNSKVNRITCSACDSRCLSCVTSDTCSRVRDGFYLDASGNYQKCPNLCNRCSLVENKVVCSVCALKATIEDGLCVACIDLNCIKCNKKGECDTCAGGFWKNGSVCTRCSPPCGACLNPSNCVSCQSGHYLSDSALGVCSKCPLNCATCSNQVTCTRCNGYYFVNGNSECSLCLANCISCTDNATCNTCRGGYYRSLSTGVIRCVICPANCKECKEVVTEGVYSVECISCKDTTKVLPCN